MNNNLLLKFATAALTVGACMQVAEGQNKLMGKAVLPASTTSPGPMSGKYIGAGPIAGQAVPFAAQPVQGISALIDNKDGSYMAMPDNGYGSIENSADFYLRVYKIKPTFKTTAGGAGTIEVQQVIELNDKDNKIPFTITNHFTADRKLTGADFDIESIQRAADGTYWIGDEFGPFLLHFDETGKLLEAPIELPDLDNAGKFVRSPQNPNNEEASAIRVMNAYRTHAMMHGNNKAPVFSPNATLIDDGDTTTNAGDRKSPTGGLAKASTDIFNVTSIKNAGYPVVCWTVNDSASIVKLLNLGVNGIISDYPDLLMRLVSAYDKDNNSQPDFLDADGLVDKTKFDAQAHRGGRGLRPENTLPSMEFGLDYLVSTLETDCGITKDGIPILSHDPHIQFSKAFKIDGTPYTSVNDEVLIKDLTLAELQSTFTLNKLLGGTWTKQSNDTTLSPVAVAFMKSKGLKTYTIPTLQQLFDFVAFYVEYYKTGDGKNHPNAVKRAKNAEKVRFNIETKFNPRTDNDERGVQFISRTVPADSFAVKIAKVIIANNLAERADIQSFAHQTLLKVQTDFPSIRTVYLFTDSPKLPTNANDGGNLQPQGDNNKSPWLGGLYWPYRSTKQSNPMRAQRSGGFEGMALSVNKDKLWPLLELPLAGDNNKTIWLSEFDLATKRYTGNRFKYKFGQGTNIGDFCMFNDKNGLIIERDNNQGPPAVIKRIYKVTINNTDTLTKTLVVDLMNLQDNDNISAGLNTLGTDFGVGTSYKFPYQTIESVVVLDSVTLVTINDNNYPFSVGRHVGNPSVTTDDITDDNEMIIVRLDQSNQLGQVVTALEENEGAKGFTAIGSYPNPFTTQATLSVSLAQASTISINVVNIFGEVVETIELGRLNEGYHNLELKNSSKWRSGIYTVKLKANDKEYMTKMVKAE